jgi:hypothetical protein
MISILIYLLVALLVIALVWWIVDYIPVPDPINRWAKIVVIVIGALIIINVLLSVAGVNTGIPVR